MLTVSVLAETIITVVQIMIMRKERQNLYYKRFDRIYTGMYHDNRP